MVECKDDRLAEVDVTRPLTVAGFQTLAQVDLHRQEFENDMQAAISSNPLSTAINTNGETEFYNSFSNVQNFLRDRNDINQYPNLSERWDKGTITPIEYAAFVNEYSYNLKTVDYQRTFEPSKILKNLDNYYGGSFFAGGAGGFCRSVPNIFAAATALFTILDSANSLIKDALSFVNSLDLNFVKIKSLLAGVKEKLKSMIDNVIDKVKGIVENFSIENIMGDIETFVNQKIVSKIKALKDNLLNAFSEENIEALKKKAENMVNYAVSLFKDPKLEDIQYLVYRFCGFMANLEQSLLFIKAPLDRFQNRYQRSYKKLKSGSDRNTADAVANGAKRMGDQERKAKKQEQERNWTSNTDGRIPTPDSVANVAGVPSWFDIMGPKDDGNGADTRFRFSGKWIKTIDPEGWEYMKQDGWNKVKPEVRRKLVRFQDLMRKNCGISTIQINSAYRSPAYQEWLVNVKKNTGVAEYSNHQAGVALDITWDGWPKNLGDAVAIAQHVGFEGFGYYSSFLHMDTGPTRTWSGKNAVLPGPASDDLELD